MSGDDNMSEDDFSGSNVEYVDNSCPKDFAAAVSPLTAPVECSRPKDFAATLAPRHTHDYRGKVGQVNHQNGEHGTQETGGDFDFSNSTTEATEAINSTTEADKATTKATKADTATPSHTHNYRGKVGQVNHQNGERGIQKTGGNFKL